MAEESLYKRQRLRYFKSQTEANENSQEPTSTRHNAAASR